MYQHLEVAGFADIDVTKLKHFIFCQEFESESVEDDISLDGMDGNILKHIKNIKLIQEMVDFMEAAKSMFL